MKTNNKLNKIRSKAKDVCVWIVIGLVIGCIVGWSTHTAIYNITHKEPEVSVGYVTGKLENIGELATQKLTYSGKVPLEEGSIPFITKKGFVIYFKSCSQYIYPLPVERTDNKQVFYNIAILDDAIRKKKKVLFEYAEYHTDKKMHLKKREDGSVREYIITPYQMAVQEGKYYLICNYDKYDDISNYRVDRIRNIQILEEKGKPFETLKWSGHQPMNLNEYMKEHVYMYSSENVFVKFRIVKAMISDVIDLFGKGVNFSEETDTHVSVSVHVNERAAEQFAKNYAPDVVILQPKRLRDKLRDDLKKAWEAYED